MHLSRRTVAWIAIAIAGAWTLSGVAIFLSLPSWETRGQLGDMFGAVNSLFSGLAFAGVVFALLSQREELQLQRDELRAAREEQKRLVHAQQQASEALNRQFQIQTLAAQIAVLQVIVSEASASLQRGSDAVIAALHAGQSGAKSEDFAPGASKRLSKAQDEMAAVLKEIQRLVEEGRNRNNRGITA